MGAKWGRRSSSPLARWVFFAQMPLSRTILDIMRKGKRIVVKVQVFGGRQMAVEMGLERFSSALKKL